MLPTEEETQLKPQENRVPPRNSVFLWFQLRCGFSLKFKMTCDQYNKSRDKQKRRSSHQQNNKKPSGLGGDPGLSRTDGVVIEVITQVGVIFFPD